VSAIALYSNVECCYSDNFLLSRHRYHSLQLFLYLFRVLFSSNTIDDACTTHGETPSSSSLYVKTQIQPSADYLVLSDLFMSYA
jgi:hypothetical protein